MSSLDEIFCMVSKKNIKADGLRLAVGLELKGEGPKHFYPQNPWRDPEWDKHEE